MMKETNYNNNTKSVNSACRTQHKREGSNHMLHNDLPTATAARTSVAEASWRLTTSNKDVNHQHQQNVAPSEPASKHATKKPSPTMIHSEEEGSNIPAGDIHNSTEKERAKKSSRTTPKSNIQAPGAFSVSRLEDAINRERRAARARKRRMEQGNNRPNTTSSSSSNKERRSTKNPLGRLRGTMTMKSLLRADDLAGTQAQCNVEGFLFDNEEFALDQVEAGLVAREGATHPSRSFNTAKQQDHKIGAVDHQHGQHVNSSPKEYIGEDGILAISADDGNDAPTNRLRAMCASHLSLAVACLLVVNLVAALCIVGGFSTSPFAAQFSSFSEAPTSSPAGNDNESNATVMPISYGWVRTSVISKDDVESFGYSIDLSQDGSILAVASPVYDGSRGRLDIFRDHGGGKEWHPIGEPIVGDLTGDQLGIGMAISGDGKAVAVGLPGNNHGTVQVYSIHPTKGLEQKGQSLVGPVPLSQFGYSVALNKDGSRLFVGAPEFGDSPEDIYGLVQAYDFDGTAWVQVGTDMIGESPNTRFGESVSTDDSGDRVAIGAPTDSVQWEREGTIDLFTWNDLDWVQLNANTELKGSQAGAHIGQRVSMARSGAFVGSGGHNRNYEKFLESGIVRTWRIDKDTDHFTWVGDPVSGTYEMAHLGHHIDIDIMTCDTSSTASLRNVLTMVTSSKNRNGEVGYALFAKLGFDGFSETKFEGPELGDTEWFGEGPPVTMAGQRCRFAVGYESIRLENSSRSEVHIYDYVAV